MADGKHSSDLKSLKPQQQNDSCWQHAQVLGYQSTKKVGRPAERNHGEK